MGQKTNTEKEREKEKKWYVIINGIINFLAVNIEFVLTLIKGSLVTYYYRRQIFSGIGTESDWEEHKRDTYGCFKLCALANIIIRKYYSSFVFRQCMCLIFFVLFSCYFFFGWI